MFKSWLMPQDEVYSLLVLELDRYRDSADTQSLGIDIETEKVRAMPPYLQLTIYANWQLISC